MVAIPGDIAQLDCDDFEIADTVRPSAAELLFQESG